MGTMACPLARRSVLTADMYLTFHSAGRRFHSVRVLAGGVGPQVEAAGIEPACSVRVSTQYG
jgi:hypothetical protein